MSTKSIVFINNAQKFYRDLDRSQEDVRRICREALPKGAATYARYAAELTFPKKDQLNMKKPNLTSDISTESEHPYYRMIINLKALCSKKGIGKMHATREDYAALRAGMRFKIVSNNHMTAVKSAPRKVVYARTKSEAVKAAKIETRAYAKAMWGHGLEEIGAKVPSNIRTLMKRLGTERRDGHYELEDADTDLQSIVAVNDVSYIDKVAPQNVAQRVEGYVTKTLAAEIYKRLKL